MAPRFFSGLAAGPPNWLYPLGFLGLGFANTLFTQWIVYKHTGSGVGAAIGTVLLLSYLLQGLFNPTLGYHSDRIRHPRGPRLPLITLGSLPMALVYCLLWQISDFWPSLILICLYGLLFVLVVQPYVALLPSIAPDPARRVRYSLVGGIFSLLASGTALIGGPQILQSGSYEIFGLIGGAGLVLTVFLPSLLMRAAPGDPPEEPLPFLRQLHSALAYKPLFFFLGGNACVVLAVIALTIVSPFMSTGLLAQSRGYTSVLNGCVFTGILLMVALMALRGQKLSYLRLLRNLAGCNGLMLSLFAVASFYIALPRWCWELGFVSVGCLVLAGMMAPTLILSGFSDHFRQAREGLLFGLNGLAINFANACSSQITALLLTRGSTPGKALGVQLVLCFAASAALCAGILLSLALLWQARYADAYEQTLQPQ